MDLSTGNSSFKIAVLLTCFNRKEKTRACLLNLFNQVLPENVSIEVFLCDDNSTDGTGEMLELEFPQVKKVKGNGNLYWGGGMRAAWKAAKNSANFDAYLWLNDDTFLLPNAIKNLFSEYQEIGKLAILCAACRVPNTQLFSYGAFDEKMNPLAPSGTVQEVFNFNGNVVFVPQKIEEKIGMISPLYTHYLGDVDYGLRAKKEGLPCYMTSTYLAECDINQIPNWADPKASLIKRWRMAHHVKGRALKEYVAFKSYHYGKFNGIISWVDLYLRLVFTDKYIATKNFFLSR